MIKVSVIMVTYNHENYILQAIDGILMQEFDFEMELIIANDNSPDNTDVIIINYLQNKILPKNIIVKYTKHEINKGMNSNFIWALSQAKGKYIAMCEGDDYWNNPLKLKIQVDFLEKNPEFSFSCHRYQIYSEFDKKFDKEIYPLKFTPYNKDLKGVIIDKTVYHSNWVTQPLTAVFRRNSLLQYDLKQFKYFRDVHLFYLLLMNDKGFCHDFNAGVYRKHEGGVHIGSTNAKRCKEAILITEELYLFSNDNKFFKIYIANAIGLIRYKKHLGILFKSFFVNLSIKHKIDILKFSFQYIENR